MLFHVFMVQVIRVNWRFGSASGWQMKEEEIDDRFCVWYENWEKKKQHCVRLTSKPEETAKKERVHAQTYIANVYEIYFFVWTIVMLFVC